MQFLVKIREWKEKVTATMEYGDKLGDIRASKFISKLWIPPIHICKSLQHLLHVLEKYLLYQSTLDYFIVFIYISSSSSNFRPKKESSYEIKHSVRTPNLELMPSSFITLTAEFKVDICTDRRMEQWSIQTHSDPGLFGPVSQPGTLTYANANLRHWPHPKR